MSNTEFLKLLNMAGKSRHETSEKVEEPMASILENFEKTMDIKPFSIDIDSVELCSDTLSFENDTLSFENDKYEDLSKEVVSNDHEDSYDEYEKEPNLEISKQDLKKITDWLRGVKSRIHGSKGIDLFNYVVDRLNDRKIHIDELYGHLKELKNYIR